MMSNISNHYCSLLKQCCETQNLIQAKKLHCRIITSIFYPETFLLNNLINSYIKLNNIESARKVFDAIPRPNHFSWNTILSAYSKSGDIPEMQNIFRLIPRKDGVSWNLVISGYALHRSSYYALKAYKFMLSDQWVSLNRITVSTMLILSSREGWIQLGRQIHGQVMKCGFESYMYVGSPLVDMYAKMECIHEARRVFDELPERNVVVYNTLIMGFLRCGMVKDASKLFLCMPERDPISWTSMISGLMQNGLDEEAIDWFRKMIIEGLSVDQFTFGSILTACGGLMAFKEGRQVHGFVIKTDYMNNVFVGSALVDMYSKCKSIKYAETVFKSMGGKNIVSWTAMVVGYGQNGFSEEAIQMFCDMQRNRIEVEEHTLGSVISSCANLASLEEGLQFHAKALGSGLNLFITVSNALITLYCKCGSIEDAHRLFSDMEVKDEVSWTALVSGYAQFGNVSETIDLFGKMVANGRDPDSVTFIAVLSACSRAGLVDKGHYYFDLMVGKYGINPTVDHYTCMIDILSRAGRLEEAKDFIQKMPFHPDARGWSTLLSSCRMRGNLEIGKWAAYSLLQLEPQNPASYVLLTSMYAAIGKWDEVAELRRIMRDKGVRKETGFSWIKYKNRVHIFSADDKSSPFSGQIIEELERLNLKMIAEGYVPDTSSVLHDVEESEKIKLLNRHSERLAIAFGLLFFPPQLPIRVVKNLRVCRDCHSATKFISKITQREILVRDAVRYHLFKDGSCSCGDFW